MSLAAGSFEPPCLLGYYPCITNPLSKDCAVIDTCSKDLYFCKFAKLQFADGTDISCKRYSFACMNCTHGGGSCSGWIALERRHLGVKRR
jgi:hypothetical protein